MADSPALRRLPGRLQYLRRLGLGASHIALWLGPNALIQSQLHMYRESYRQFDYPAIQALVLRKTPRGLWYSAGLAAMAALFGLFAYAASEPVSRGIMYGVAGFWGFFLLMNLARGGTCRVEIQTALGRRDLPTLNRVRPARRALRLIAEQVERAQGPLPADDAAAMMERFLPDNPNA